MNVQLYLKNMKHLDNNDKTFGIGVRIMRITTNINLWHLKNDVAALWVSLFLSNSGLTSTS